MIATVFRLVFCVAEDVAVISVPLAVGPADINDVEVAVTICADSRSPD